MTAIYWHVGNKQALLDGLVDRIIADLGEENPLRCHSFVVPAGFFGKRDHVDRGDIELFKYFERNPKMSFSSIDDDQIGQIVLFFCSA